METDFVSVTPEEKKSFEKWLLENGAVQHKRDADTQLLILYKLSLLENKINKIEQQTKTHWVN